MEQTVISKGRSKDLKETHTNCSQVKNEAKDEDVLPEKEEFEL